MEGQITAYPMGGEFSTFSLDKGNYHCKVGDAGYAESKKGRTQLFLDLIVENDPNHPAKEGKKLTRHYQSLPMSTDDAEKIKTLKGFCKRMIYDGFGLKWPAVGQEKPLDPRSLVTKNVWVQVGDKKNADGSKGTGVVAFAQSADKLPAPKVDASGNGATGGNGAAPRRRR